MEEEVDLSKELTRQQYEAIVSKALDTHEQDAEFYLKKVQARMERLESYRRPIYLPLPGCYRLFLVCQAVSSSKRHKR